LRTQQIIAYESGVINTIDPLAGSYFVEELTDKIQQEAEEYISRIDSIGGMIPAIESGYVQNEIQDAAYKHEKAVESGERIIVGVNKFKTNEQEYKDILKIDLKVQEEQINFLKKVKSERNSDSVNEKLNLLKDAARGDQNMIPYILDAVKVYASIGEICNALRSIFGEYGQSGGLSPVPPDKSGQAFPKERD
jgi:methylmalonyl-CoA mutase N-terminal domain/subunit